MYVLQKRYRLARLFGRDEKQRIWEDVACSRFLRILKGLLNVKLKASVFGEEPNREPTEYRIVKRTVEVTREYKQLDIENKRSRLLPGMNTEYMDDVDNLTEAFIQADVMAAELEAVKEELDKVGVDGEKLVNRAKAIKILTYSYIDPEKRLRPPRRPERVIKNA